MTSTSRLWGAPDIKANNADGPVTLSRGDKLSLTVSLDVAGEGTTSADWWLLANTAFGGYYYQVVSDTWKPGLGVSYQGPLIDLPQPLEVLNISDLPAGSYLFQFGVDPKMDGRPAMPLNYDAVEVIITP